METATDVVPWLFCIISLSQARIHVESSCSVCYNIKDHTTDYGCNGVF